MSRSTTFKEELELDEIREREEELRRREWEYAESQRRIAEERSERERTIPPMEVIQERMDRKRHEENVTRGQIKNERRAQNHSLLLLVMLVTATCSLVWWGLKLMQGG